ncbi:hypothetical protein PISMIDRAFT_113384, partial [Pisolithus microcarpus 441]
HLVKVLKHIFVSPSSALSNGESKSTHPGNSKLHGMHEVTAEHITYSTVHAHYSLTSHEKWKQHDSVFDYYADFYYRILNFISKPAFWPTAFQTTQTFDRPSQTLLDPPDPPGA